MSGFVQKGTTAAVATGSLTASITGVTAGNQLICTWAGDTNTAPTAPTNWTQRTGGGAASNGTAIYYLTSFSASAGTTSITFPSISTTQEATIAEFNGITAVGNAGSTTSHTANTTATSSSYTPSQANEIIIASCATPGSLANENISDPPASWTGSAGVEQNASSFSAYEAAYRVVTTTAAVTATWTWTTSGVSETAIAGFKYTPAGATTINLTPGTWSWAGANATFNELFALTPGAWSWTGTNLTFSELINLTPGTWSWAGANATFSELFSLTPGAWSWTGTNFTFSSLTNLSPAAWSWAGTGFTFSELISLAPGAWSWAGTGFTFSELISLAPGTWSWAGTNFSFGAGGPTIVNFTPGLWSWVGLNVMFGTPPPPPSGIGGSSTGYSISLQWFPFANREALFVWMLEHAMIHQHYAAKLSTVYGVQPPLFDLIDQPAAADWAHAMEGGGMTPALHSWLLAHTRLHQAESVPLNLPTPPDLTTVDFRDENQFYDWMNDHQALHDAQDLVLS